MYSNVTKDIVRKSKGISKSCQQCFKEYSGFLPEHICKRCLKSVCVNCSIDKLIIVDYDFMPKQKHRVCQNCSIESKFQQSLINDNQLMFGNTSPIAIRWLIDLKIIRNENIIEDLAKLESQYQQNRPQQMIQTIDVTSMKKRLSYSLRDFISKIQSNSNDRDDFLARKLVNLLNNLATSLNWKTLPNRFHLLSFFMLAFASEAVALALISHIYTRLLPEYVLEFINEPPTTASDRFLTSKQAMKILSFMNSLSLVEKDIKPAKAFIQYNGLELVSCLFIDMLSVNSFVTALDLLFTTQDFEEIENLFLMLVKYHIRYINQQQNFSKQNYATVLQYLCRNTQFSQIREKLSPYYLSTSQILNSSSISESASSTSKTNSQQMQSAGNSKVNTSTQQRKASQSSSQSSSESRSDDNSDQSESESDEEENQRNSKDSSKITEKQYLNSSQQQTRIPQQKQQSNKQPLQSSSRPLLHEPLQPKRVAPINQSTSSNDNNSQSSISHIISYISGSSSSNASNNTNTNSQVAQYESELQHRDRTIEQLRLRIGELLAKNESIVSSNKTSETKLIEAQNLVKTKVESINQLTQELQNLQLTNASMQKDLDKNKKEGTVNELFSRLWRDLHDMQSKLEEATIQKHCLEKQKNEQLEEKKLEHVQNSERLQAVISSLEAKLLIEQNNMRNQLTQFTAKELVYNREIEDAKIQNRILESKIVELTQKSEKHANELAELAKNNQLALAELEQNLAEYKQKYEKLLKSNEQLTKESASQAETIRERDSLIFNELNRMNTSLKEEIETMHSHVQELKDSLERVASESSNSVSELSQANSELQSMKERVEQYEISINDLKNSLEVNAKSSSEQVSKLQFEVSAVTLKKEAAEKEVAELSKKYNGCFESIGILTGQLGENKKKFEDSEKQRIDFDRENQSLKNSFSESSKTIEQLELKVKTIQEQLKKINEESILSKTEFEEQSRVFEATKANEAARLEELAEAKQSIEQLTIKLAEVEDVNTKTNQQLLEYQLIFNSFQKTVTNVQNK